MAEPMGAGWAWRALGAVGRHPSLWVTGARQAFVLAAPGWWRRRPFLPLPSPEYLRFRLQTAYGGDGDRAPDPRDVVTYLDWCRAARRWGRQGPGDPKASQAVPRAPNAPNAPNGSRGLPSAPERSRGHNTAT